LENPSGKINRSVYTVSHNTTKHRNKLDGYGKFSNFEKSFGAQ